MLRWDGKVETYFLHAPDPTTPIAETMDAIQELYEAGRFNRVKPLFKPPESALLTRMFVLQFGVSNFTVSQLQELLDYASPKGYVLPSVYEGNYSAITRHLEKEIFPFVRKHKMSFFAYSPLAGGFLVKTAQTIQEAKEVRWSPETRVGAMYQKMYNRPKLLAALSDWSDISEKSGITKAGLAYRWMVHHSKLSSEFGDAIIVGASRPAQLDDTLSLLRMDPLDGEIVDRINTVWETVKDQAPIDNVQDGT